PRAATVARSRQASGATVSAQGFGRPVPLPPDTGLPTGPATATAVPSLTPEVVYPMAAAGAVSLTRPPLAPEPTPPPGALPTLDLACDAALFERLRSQRTALARTESLPPYCIFNDRTLREMATHLPATHASLLQIYG